MTLTRYNRTGKVTIHERRCLWYGVFRSEPVRVILVREPRRPSLALVTPGTAGAGLAAAGFGGVTTAIVPQTWS